jgi:hypothetical protein
MEDGFNSPEVMRRARSRSQSPLEVPFSAKRTGGPLA